MAGYSSKPGAHLGPAHAHYSGDATVQARHAGGFLENGRFYGNPQYLFPYDEDEKERLDIFHKIFMIARKDEFFKVPVLTLDEPRILDLGCGTGIWAIDVADKFPKVRVLGVDLALIQPEFIPPNVRFCKMDIEKPWEGIEGIEPGKLDFIHMRTLVGSVAHWPHLYAQVFRHLAHSGWMEQVEIDFIPRSDDGSVTRHSYVSQWAEELMDATEKLGRSMRVNAELIKRRIAAAGLGDIQHTEIEVPVNGWPSDPHPRELGRWFNLGLKQGIHALTAAPLSRAHGRSTEEILSLTQKVTAEIHSREVRGYCILHIFTARKP